uniref:Reverse transcriptase zinc-binding domain-containing protein n=1 Tax=Fagus sylvatica TaxID=28930 RepID=A0A2N9FGA8_FAGSY
MVAKFWWGQKGVERKIHWKKWDTLSRAKQDGGLGFRDLHSFNITLLAKQGWHLLTQPQSLFYRVFKEKYFPHHSFIHAQLGSHPSFFWSSVMAAQPLILDGLRWKVGNGRTINIWTDPWLPTNPIRRANTVGFDTVDQLIDPDFRSWNLQLLEQLFTDREVSQIVSITLGTTSRLDQLTWRHIEKGEFTVQSAYLQLTKGLSSNAAESSNAEQTKWFWKKLWRLKVPTKCKHLLWRACTVSLPTRSGLQRRGVHIDPKCLLCGYHEETTTHILWACPLARNVWALAKGKANKMPNTEEADFRDLTIALASSKHPKELEQWTTLTWAIWNARNKFIFEGHQDHPTQIFQTASTLLQDYQQITLRSRIQPTTPESH